MKKAKIGFAGFSVAMGLFLVMTACKKSTTTTGAGPGSSSVVPSTGTWTISVTATGGNANPNCGTSSATANGTITLVSSGTFAGTMSGASVTGCVGSLDANCTPTYCAGTVAQQAAGIQFCSTVFGTAFGCSSERRQSYLLDGRKLHRQHHLRKQRRHSDDDASITSAELSFSRRGPGPSAEPGPSFCAGKDQTIGKRRAREESEPNPGLGVRGAEDRRSSGPGT